MKIYYLLFLCLSFSPFLLGGSLYKWVDKNGNTHYSDEKPTAQSSRIIELTLQPLNSFEPFAPKEKEKEKEKEEKKLASPEKPKKPPKKSPTDCSGPSPITNNTPLHRIKLSKAQHASLSLLMLAMKGKWQGSATRIQCKGIASNPIYAQSNYTVSADIKLKRFKDITIEFSMYSAKKRITTHENISLFLSDEFLSYSDYQSDETVLLNTSEQTIELWVENFPIAGVRNELVRVFEVQQKTILITQFHYVSGALASVMKWDLFKH